MASKNRGGKKSSQLVSRSRNSIDQGELLKKAIQWVVTQPIFKDFKKHGNSTWSPSAIAILAILTAWMPSPQLTEAFAKASDLSTKLFGVLAIQTYQGMMRALVSNGSSLLMVLWLQIHGLMEAVSSEYFRIDKWLPLAVDGTRFTTPRTESNEAAFAAKNYGYGVSARRRTKWKNKKRRSKKIAPIKPQIWLTLIWHMGVKLPWCWKMGPSTSSERHHLMDMLKKMIFPEKTLFCGDAGFVGYELWSTIIQQGHSFLFRVGGNVRLLNKLAVVRQYEDLVYFWPNHIAKKNQPPLILRLIKVTTIQGTMYLVTNILEEKELGIKSLAKLYPLRWGIELQFRSAKQTFGLGSLRSRNAEHALVELDWSLVALTIVQLLAIKEQIQIDIPPERSSVSEAIKAIRHAVDTWSEIKPKGENFKARLQRATKDDYYRTGSKEARYKPNYKDKPNAKKPIVVTANAKQRAKYQALLMAA
jgi:hypothetical protein